MFYKNQILHEVFYHLSPPPTHLTIFKQFFSRVQLSNERIIDNTLKHIAKC